MNREHKQHGSKRRAVLKTYIVVFAVLLLILVMTNPNEEDFVAWLASEHHIHSSYNVNEGRTFMQKIDGEGRNLHVKGGHIRHMGIFSTYDYHFTDNEKSDIQIEAIGITNMIFHR